MSALLFKKTCPCTILPPIFLIFQIPPSGGGNQNLLHSFRKVGGRVRTMYIYYIYSLRKSNTEHCIIVGRRRCKATLLGTWRFLPGDGQSFSMINISVHHVLKCMSCHGDNREGTILFMITDIISYIYIYIYIYMK